MLKRIKWGIKKLAGVMTGWKRRKAGRVVYALALIVALFIPTSPIFAATPMPSMETYTQIDQALYPCGGTVLDIKVYQNPGLDGSDAFDAVSVDIEGKTYFAFLFVWGDDRENPYSEPTAATGFVSYKGDGSADKVYDFLKDHPYSACELLDLLPK